MDRVAKQRQAQIRKGGLVPAVESPRKIEQPQLSHATKLPQKPRKFDLPPLPHGSHDEAIWDAEAVLWTGKLHVPHEAGVQTFAASSRTRFTLLSALDRRYRSWLKSLEAK